MVQRRLAGQAEPEARGGIDADRAGVRPHRLDRGRGHGQRVRIEARLCDHQLPARHGRIAVLQRLSPGQLAWAVGELRLDWSSHSPEQPVELGWKRTARPRLLQRELGQGGDAAQVRGLGEHRQQGLGGRQPVGQIGKLVDLEVEKTMSREERIAGLVFHCGKMLVIGAQRPGQGRGRFLNSFRRDAFDHRYDRVPELGERLDEGGAVTPKGDIGRNHVLGAGVDAEVRQGIAGSGGAQNERGEDDRERAPVEMVDPPPQQPMPRGAQARCRQAGVPCRCERNVVTCAFTTGTLGEMCALDST